MADLSSTSNGSTSGGKTFPFMKLAPELRNHVYGFVFQGIDEIPTAPGPTSRQSDPCHVHYKSIKDLQPYLALPQTSHCIRQESLSMLFESYITRHSWLVASKDNATALADLTGFVCALAPARAQDMQLCLCFDTRKSPDNAALSAPQG
jgi:hypothetical protein